MKPRIHGSKRHAFSIAGVSLLVLLAASVATRGLAQDAGAQNPAMTTTEIGGQKVVTLTRTPISTTRPEFTSITVAPGRGMEVLQITANFPGKGNVNVLASPDLAGAKKMLDVDDTANGDLGYRLGAAFLVPYPNRIRGKLSADGQTLTTEWQGHTLTLPANNIGKLPTAERHAMHGLILKAKTDDVKVQNGASGGEVTGIIHAGDFGGHWLSKTDLAFTIRLTAEDVDASIDAKNVGSEAEPIAIAWHPYFNLPSGDRTQVRLRIPASSMAQVDSYDNVFPTGKIVDPAAHYGIDVIGLSPEIRAIQMYAPPTQKFVAIEHQYNFGDPFGKEWGATNTGMVTLKPGQSTRWHVRLHVFIP